MGDYARIYSKGYSAGRRNAWPDHAPPAPPHEQVAKLFATAVALHDAAKSVCCAIDCDTKPFIELENQVYALEDVFAEISKWLKSQIPPSE